MEEFIAHPFVLALVGGLVLIAGNRCLKIYDDRKSLQKKKDADLSDVVKGQKEQSRALDRIESLLKDFIAFVNKNPAFKKTQFFYSTSPLRLTEQAETVANESGITGYIKTHLENYKKELSQEDKDYRVYEVCQQLAKTALDSNVNDEIDSIKEYFYKNGLEKEILETIFSLKIRDLYKNIVQGQNS